MLYFPERLSRGDVANVDFLHLYGPGSLYLLQAWYALSGVTLEAERTYGLIQNLGIVFALYALARPWGRTTAAATGSVAALVTFTAAGLTAMAWNGAVALGLWATVFALRGMQGEEGRSRTRRFVIAGLFAGLALTFRPDLFIALLLVFGWVLWRSRAWAPLLGGALVGLLPMWVHLARAGLEPSFEGMVLDPVVELRPGRELPAPPSWDEVDGSLQKIVELVDFWYPLPALPASQQLFLWFLSMLVVSIGLVALAVVLIRRTPRSRQAMVLLASSLFALGVVPQGLQRPDSTHLAWVTCVSWPLAIVGLVELQRRWRPTWRAPAATAIAATVTVVALLVVAPFWTYRTYLTYSRTTMGTFEPGFEIERDGRRFYFGVNRSRLASQAAVDELEKRMEPGQSLLVGPRDLRRTWYSDAIFYYLFPELDPATYFIEMDPGLANEEDSGLAEEVAAADWLILTRFWDGWNEPNTSLDYGSDRPNEVVDEQFCLVGAYQDGLVELHGRCELLEGRA